MSRILTPDRLSFAVGLAGLGIVTLIVDNFALQWQQVPAWVPAQTIVAYASGVVLLLTGGGLLIRRTERLASRVFLVYAVLWLLLKLPAALASPLVEANWLGAGELAVILAAALTLATGGTKFGTYLFALALIPIGLSHFVYRNVTIGFVPTWIPYRALWAYLGGAGHIAAGAGVLLGILPRLAARLEAAMIGVFTVLVWLPGVVAAPTNRLQWTAMLMSWIIAAAAWVVAEGLPHEGSASPDGVRAPASALPTSRAIADPVTRGK